MRAARKIIDTDALTHNLNVLSEMAPQSLTIAVVKANAYGHESAAITHALSGADLLAVAAIEEAQILRNVGAEQPILLLEGAFERNEVETAFSQSFELMIATPSQLDWLLSFEGRFERIWIKLDTGMGRLGFSIEDASAAMAKLCTRYALRDIVLTTHFSDADAPTRDITEMQIACFDGFAKNYPECSQCLCNSAGVLAYPDAHRDFIRPGIALYGVSPFASETGKEHGLLPVMTLKTRVLSVKSFEEGAPIGYGQYYRLPESGRIAICEIGYADGYLRFIPSGAPILIAGREYGVAGRVSMDMITVSVDDSVKVGDEVTCWGAGLPVERIANAADTIAYQLLTTVSGRPKVELLKR